MRPSKHNFMRTILICVCALVAGLAVAPATVGAQAVKDEYDLGPLPQANGDNEQTGAVGSASSDSDDSDGGASPVLLIVIGVAALAALTVAVWWMRKNRESGRQGPGGTSATKDSTSQAPSSP